jgi:hypothetical protein
MKEDDSVIFRGVKRVGLHYTQFSKTTLVFSRVTAL